MTRSPAFQFYPKDFLTDEHVMVMSLQERGAYMTLICQCWIEGSLPAEPELLARLCGVPVAILRRLWPALALCFRTREDGRLVHPRLERELQKQEAFRRRQSDKGKASGAARRGHSEGDTNRGSFSVQPDANRGSISVEPTLVEPNTNSSISDLRSPISDLQSSDSSRTKSVSSEADKPPHEPTPENSTVEPTQEPSEPPVMVFPTIGAQGHEWSLTAAHVTAWKQAFPSLDVVGEAFKALAWVQASPERRKTCRGMPRFLVRWLSHASDYARAGPSLVNPKTAGNAAALAQFARGGRG